MTLPAAIPALATLRAVQSLADREGYPPTLREVAGDRGLSVTTVHGHLDRLREDGMLTWVSGRPRTMRLTQAGRVALRGARS